MGLGCDQGPPPVDREPESKPVAIGTEFNPENTGNVRGCVRWQSDIPSAPPFRAAGYAANGQYVPGPIIRENPNLPHIDARTGAVAGAVVFLRGIDPQKSRPENWPPVRIEMRDLCIHVCQGSRDSQVGFLRPGDRVTMVSKDPAFHMLWGRGAAFFSLPFPDPDAPRERRLNDKGIVELSSGAGYPWMRGYLFVDDHPYYSCTDQRGRFQLMEVPHGRYQLACWQPSWRVSDAARDPETALVIRVTFAPPVKSVQDIDVQPGRTLVADFTITAP